VLNLLVTDLNPRQAAMDLDDRRVAKGLLDATQILCTSMDLLGCWNRAMYRPRNENDPTVVWATRSKNNLRWVYHYAFALGDEWKLRMGKPATHGSQLVADICWETFKAHPECHMYRLELTPFVNYTPYTAMQAIPAFQRLLCEKKFDGTSKWTSRHKPGWYKPPSYYNNAV